MASKKYLLLTACLVVLFQTISSAQTSTTDWGWNWKDSSKVATKNIPQYNEFLNNQFPYPARPRDQWELGFSAGHSLIVGDVPMSFSSASTTGFSRGAYVGGVVVGASLRKSLGHVFSVRGGFSYSSDHVPHYVSGVFSKPTLDASTSAALSVDFLASLNSSSYYRGNPKSNIYVLAGYSLVNSVVTKTLGGSPSNFTGVTFNNTLSGTVNGNKLNVWYHALDLGFGYAYKLSNKINLGIEEKLLLPVPGMDYLDGISTGKSNDFINYVTAKVNINIGNSAKRVQPLWWINANNYAYNELNAPKHMKMPKVVLPDADGDGVTDQFDLEPNTPAGAPVDSHGVSKDTDGDGVPDYRDKELLTPQKCFPVNNDGVGTCPEPACCKELRDQIANMQLVSKTECAITDLPSVQFKSGAALTKDAQKLLDAAAAKIKANPNCKVKVIGHPAASKAAQQLSYERVSAIIKYFVEKQGVAENRFIFNYDGGTGDASTIDLQGTTEEGPNTVPAPHPNLKHKG